MRVLGLMVVALLAGCPTRSTAKAGMVFGGGFVVVGIVSGIAMTDRPTADRDKPEMGPTPSAMIYGLGALAGLISLVSYFTIAEDDESPEPPPEPVASPIIDSPRLKPTGMAGIAAAISRCGHALELTGVIRVQVVVLDGRVTGRPEADRADLASCLATELAAVSFQHASKIDTSISILVK